MILNLNNMRVTWNLLPLPSRVHSSGFVEHSWVSQSVKGISADVAATTIPAHLLKNTL
jgi:hypothetical protein